jgi:hypothetical protein
MSLPVAIFPTSSPGSRLGSLRFAKADGLLGVGPFRSCSLRSVWFLFFSVEGVKLGSKRSLFKEIHDITGISEKVLLGSRLYEFEVEERLRWAASRKTRKVEDAA